MNRSRVSRTSLFTLLMGLFNAPIWTASAQNCCLVLDRAFNQNQDTSSLVIRHNGDSPISPAFVLQNDGGGDIEQVFLFGENSKLPDPQGLGGTNEAGRIIANWHGLTIKSKSGAGLFIDGTINTSAGLSVAGTIAASGGLNVNGTTRTSVLEITGGDLAESFAITRRAPIQPGMVVVIDPANPGQLRMADHPYDRGVAGIIAGANGIKSGVTLSSGPTSAEKTQPVALTGRVYAWADATLNPIRPGDLLTTANTPGHAMKVTNYARAQGAVLGKAMSALSKGKGLVLVLVSLQ